MTDSRPLGQEAGDILRRREPCLRECVRERRLVTACIFMPAIECIGVADVGWRAPADAQVAAVPTATASTANVTSKVSASDLSWVAGRRRRYGDARATTWAALPIFCGAATRLLAARGRSVPRAACVGSASHPTRSIRAPAGRAPRHRPPARGRRNPRPALRGSTDPAAGADGPRDRRSAGPPRRPASERAEGHADRVASDLDGVLVGLFFFPHRECPLERRERLVVRALLVEYAQPRLFRSGPRQ